MAGIAFLPTERPVIMSRSRQNVTDEVGGEYSSFFIQYLIDRHRAIIGMVL